MKKYMAEDSVKQIVFATLLTEGHGATAKGITIVELASRKNGVQPARARRAAESFVADGIVVKTKGRYIVTPGALPKIGRKAESAFTIIERDILHNFAAGQRYRTARELQQEWVGLRDVSKPYITQALNQAVARGLLVQPKAGGRYHVVDGNPERTRQPKAKGAICGACGKTGPRKTVKAP